MGPSLWASTARLWPLCSGLIHQIFITSRRTTTTISASRDIKGAFATGHGATATATIREVHYHYDARSPLEPRPGPVAYNLPVLVPYYQARATDLVELRTKLGSPQATIGIIGLRGMGGIGKTVLAVALARDPSVRTKFTYGVTWLTFGRDALPLAKAAELATAITGRTIRFESVGAARGQLGEITKNLALLVVLDDVWEPEATDPFAGLGPKCRVLVTTRDARVLARMNANRHDLGLLTHASARDLLAAATELPGADVLPPEADAIIHHCGHLPLALAAAGGLLTSR